MKRFEGSWSRTLSHALSRSRWILFALYVFFFVTLPFAILFDRVGMAIGAVLFTIVMVALRYRGVEKIVEKLKAIPLSEANAPVLCHLIEEHCRRKEVSPVPKLVLIPSPSLNGATFGFSLANATIGVTQGLLDTLTRTELSQALAIHVDLVKKGDFVHHTWLARFLALVDGLIAHRPGEPKQGRRKSYSFRFIFRQALFIPLVLFPFMMLRGKKPRLMVMSDGASVAGKTLPLRISLVEAFRKMEASSVRQPLSTPFSLRHLFLLTPRSREPIVRLLLFDEEFAAETPVRSALNLQMNHAT